MEVYNSKTCIQKTTLIRKYFPKTVGFLSHVILAYGLSKELLSISSECGKLYYVAYKGTSYDGNGLVGVDVIIR